jgi:16S rRNA (cytidine1402-2'-O)-methyltransferase
LNDASEAPDPDTAHGRLSIVATPIGNLDDVTLRALSTLRAAQLILAEDTRQTRKLLTHHGISGALRAFHAHSSEGAIARCLRELAEGKHLALVTDAGTPLISDPGARLVTLAREQGAFVESIPGASAVTAALSVCGVAFDAFRFAGFAPRSGSKRDAWLDRIARDEGASVFFESPARLGATLGELAERLHPERALAVCRELTKLHEEVVRGTAAELAQRFANGARGEITVVVAAGQIAPEPAAAEAEPALDERIAALLADGVSARDIARRLARELGLPRRSVYARASVISHQSSAISHQSSVVSRTED